MVVQPFMFNHDCKFKTVQIAESAYFLTLVHLNRAKNVMRNRKIDRTRIRARTRIQWIFANHAFILSFRSHNPPSSSFATRTI